MNLNKEPKLPEINPQYDSLLMIRRGQNWDFYHKGIPFGTVRDGVFVPQPNAKVPEQFACDAAFQLLNLVPVPSYEEQIKALAFQANQYQEIPR